MKSNQISIIIASLILGISFIVGCSLINNGRGLMDIIKTERVYSASGTFTGTGLPYFMVNGEYLFNKDLLLNWINEASLEKRVYLNGQMH